MKKKLIFASLFATFIILAQGILAPSVVANEEDIETITLTSEQRTDLENIISSFEGYDIYDILLNIYNSNINDLNEFNINAINEILVEMSGFIVNSDIDINSILAIPISELIEYIVFTVVYHIAIIPFAMLAYILEDINEIIIFYMEGFSDPGFTLSISVAIFLPDLYEILIQLEIIKDYTVGLPSIPDDKKQYLKELFFQAVGTAFTSCLISTGVFLQIYLYPKLGYLSRMGLDLVGLTSSAKELVSDGKLKLEHFKEIFIDVPIAFIDFVDIRDFEIIKDFASLIVEINEAKDHAELWYEEWYTYGPEVLLDIAGVVTTLGDLIFYYTKSEEKPWLRPIEVQVEINGLKEGESVEISFKDPDQEDTAILDDDYWDMDTIYYQTDITNAPFMMHQFTIVAVKGEETTTVDNWAFSDSAVAIKLDFEKGRNKEKSPLSFLSAKLLQIFEFFESFFQKTLNILNI